MPPKRSTKREAADDDDFVDEPTADVKRPTTPSAPSSPATSKPGSPSKKQKGPPKGWEWEKERACLLRILATKDIKLSKELAADLQAFTGRTYDSIHGWWYRTLTPEIRLIKAAKPASSTEAEAKAEPSGTKDEA